MWFVRFQLSSWSRFECLSLCGFSAMWLHFRHNFGLGNFVFALVPLKKAHCRFRADHDLGSRRPLVTLLPNKVTPTPLNCYPAPKFIHPLTGYPPPLPFGASRQRNIPSLWPISSLGMQRQPIDSGLWNDARTDVPFTWYDGSKYI